MDYQEITYETIGPVARICHNRPAKANAENERLLAEMDDALQRARTDDGIRVVIIGGKGKHFSSGHDLTDPLSTRRGLNTERAWAWETERYLGNAMRIWDFPKPTVAQVQGACVAGGFMVANMCDLVVAADDAFFSDPVNHSLGVAAVEVLVHPWVLGLRKAKELLYTGQRISAAEAKEWGMVNHVVPRSELEAFTLGLANRIAAAPPMSTQMLKRSLNRTAEMMGFRTSVMAHFDTHHVTHSTDEHRAIMEAGRERSIQVAKDTQGNA
jgi:enoyl-CoA hydratase